MEGKARSQLYAEKEFAGLSASILDDNIDEQTQQQLVRTIFGERALEGKLAENINTYRAYFAYYTRQCYDARAGPDQSDLSDRKHRDLVDAILAIVPSEFATANSPQDHLRSKTDSVSRLRERYAQPSPEINVLTRTLELAARLLTMHEICRWAPAGHRICEPTWADSESLAQCLFRHYTQSTCEEKVALERTFHARALDKIAGITVEWTDDLTEHLELIDDGVQKIVRIFHHAAFLKAVESGLRRELFPDNLLRETLNTLALLFPNDNQEVRQWFKRESVKAEFPLDQGVLECGRLSNKQRRIDQFSYWRDRIIILKQTFDQSEPATLTQMWNDRRRKLQWSTFWMAAFVVFLTLFFGFVQCVEGALQVYWTRYPVNS